MGGLVGFLGTSSLIAVIVSIVMLVLVIKFLIRVPKALESIDNSLAAITPKKDTMPKIEVSDDL